MGSVIRSIPLLLIGAILAAAQEKAPDPKHEKEKAPPAPKVDYTQEEEQLLAGVRLLSDVGYDFRNEIAKPLALDIRRQPPSVNKLRLADALAFVATAGDVTHDTLQEVANTLAQALREQPGKLDSAYVNLARLVNYEYVKVPLEDPKLAAALKKFQADDQARREVDFELADLSGKKWHLKDLRGKVVVVNFWATWSKPCWQEVTDLKAIGQRFKKQDLVILGIFNEKPDRVTNFAKSQDIPFPILVDSGQKVTQLYRIADTGFPKSFVYNREGNLVAQAIDMRVKKQFLEMLKQAGLQ